MSWKEIVRQGVEVAEAKGKEYSHAPGDKTKVRSFAASIGVDRVELRDMTEDALLVKRPDGRITVFLNSNQPRVRHRFSIAHELSHLLLESVLGKEAIHRRRRFAPHQDPEGQRIEALCNMMASSLLMPRERVSELLSEVGWTARSVQTIAKSFDVSFEAAARRYIKVNPRQCAMMILDRSRDGRMKPTQRPVLSDALQGRSIELVAPPYGQENSISRAFSETGMVVSPEKVVISRGRGRSRKSDIFVGNVESIGRGFRNNRRVYSFISLP